MRNNLLIILAATALYAQPYNGTWTGSTSYGTGKFSQGLQGAGSSSGRYITLPAGVLNSSVFSVAFWIYGTTNGGIQQGILETSGTQALAMRVLSNGIIFCSSAPASVYLGGPNVMDSTWHQAACLYDGTTLSLWLDGSVGSSAPASISIGTATMTLGSEPSQGSFALLSTTVVDEFRVYNTSTFTSCGTSSACSNTETGARAIYHLDTSTADSLVSSSPLAAGTITSNTACIGICVTASTGGTSPYSQQLQDAAITSGACGSYSDTQSPVTGATATWYVATVSATKCYRVKVTDSAGSPATAYSGNIQAPVTGRGMGSN